MSSVDNLHVIYWCGEGALGCFAFHAPEKSRTLKIFDVLQDYCKQLQKGIIGNTRQ